MGCDEFSCYSSAPKGDSDGRGLTSLKRCPDTNPREFPALPKPALSKRFMLFQVTNILLIRSEEKIPGTGQPHYVSKYGKCSANPNELLSLGKDQPPGCFAELEAIASSPRASVPF